jgi:hypothetical protein
MTFTTPSTDDPGIGVAADIGIAILYEDRASGLHARRFTDMLVAALGEANHCTRSFWRCELIDLPEIASEIAADAAASEFLVVSLRRQTLSSATRDLIEAWLVGVRGRGASLIALFDPAATDVAAIESMRWYLRHVTAEANVAFFAHSAAPAAERPLFESEKPHLQPAGIRHGRKQRNSGAVLHSIAA